MNKLLSNPFAELGFSPDLHPRWPKGSGKESGEFIAKDDSAAIPGLPKEVRTTPITRESSKFVFANGKSYHWPEEGDHGLTHTEALQSLGVDDNTPRLAWGNYNPSLGRLELFGENEDWPMSVLGQGVSEFPKTKEARWNNHPISTLDLREIKEREGIESTLLSNPFADLTNWVPDEHPRWPKGSPDHLSGRFMPKSGLGSMKLNDHLKHHGVSEGHLNDALKEHVGKVASGGGSPPALPKQVGEIKGYPVYDRPIRNSGDHHVTYADGKVQVSDPETPVGSFDVLSPFMESHQGTNKPLLWGDYDPEKKWLKLNTFNGPSEQVDKEALRSALADAFPDAQRTDIDNQFFELHPEETAAIRAARPLGKMSETELANWGRGTLSDIKNSSSTDTKGNRLLGSVLAAQGVDKKPVLKTPEQIDALGNDKGWTDTYRGVGRKKSVDAFKNGEFFPGVGIYGDGTYVGYGDQGKDIAKQYAGTNDNGAPNIIRAALPPDAKVIDHSVATERQRADIQDLNTRYDQFKNPSDVSMLNTLYGETGTWAAINGYDAIDVPDMKYKVLLNRGILAVEDK